MTRKKVYRTQKGKVIDMEAMRVANERTVAAGNMKVNAKGDELGKGGKIVKPVRERIAPHYKTKTQTARTSIKPPIKKKDAQINTPVEKPKEEPQVQDFVVDEEPVSVSEKTRADGSVYKEMMFADGSIATEEVKVAPTKKKTKKKASKKKKDDDTES